MKVLALNTAFSNSDVALFYDDKKDYVSLESSAKQSENVLVCTDNLLKRNNISIKDIDTMAVVVGPGSFTGIRIGVGLVKGMYMANKNLKLVSICSLDLMAHIFAQTNTKKEFWCIIDALSGNIFVCKYNEKGERITEPQMLTGDNINELSGTIVGLKSDNLDISTNQIEFTPQALMSLALCKIKNNDFTEENKLLPIYLRKSQAEIGIENANKKDW